MFLDEKEIVEIETKVDPVDQALLDCVAYIKKHGWCRGDLTDDYGRVCSVGAIRYAIPNFKIHDEARAKFERVLFEKTGHTQIAMWNDSWFRTKGQVIRMFERAARSK